MEIKKFKFNAFLFLFALGMISAVPVNAATASYVHYLIPTGSNVTYTANYTKETDLDYFTLYVSSFNGSQDRAKFRAQEYTYGDYLTISNDECYSAGSYYSLYFQGFNLSTGNTVRLGVKRNNFSVTPSTVTFNVNFR